MGSVFVGNEAQNGGGVCVQECAGRSTFFDNAFTSNWADKAGGGIFQLKCSGAWSPAARQTATYPPSCPVWHAAALMQERYVMCALLAGALLTSTAAQADMCWQARSVPLCRLLRMHLWHGVTPCKGQ